MSKKDKDENILLNPEDVAKKRAEKVRLGFVPSEEDEDAGIENPQGTKAPKSSSDFRPGTASPKLAKQALTSATSLAKENIKFRKLGKLLKAEFETNGRFDAPPVIYMRDYKTDHVNHLATARPEDIFETIVAVLEECKDIEATGTDWSVGDLIDSEFLELMIGMKMQFDSPMHRHYWYCKCQNEVDDEFKKPSMQEIDLRHLTFASVEEVEEELRAQFLGYFQDEDFFKGYVERKYGGPREDVTPESESQFVGIKEPFFILAEDDDTDHINSFLFSYMRVRNMVEAYRDAAAEFDPIIRQVRNRQSGSLDKRKVSESKKTEIDKLQRKKAEAALKYAQAYCIIGFNDETDLSKADKVKLYGKLGRSGMMSLFNVWDSGKCGVRYDYESVCNLCGHTESRSLQRHVNPLELLPFSGNNELDPKSRIQRTSAFNVYFS